METIPLRDLLVNELQYEAMLTRRMLVLVPDDKADWKPHTKSMTIQELASHIAIIPAWTSSVLKSDEMDHLVTNETAFLTSSEIENLKGEKIESKKLNSEEVLALFDSNTDKAIADVKNSTNEELMKIWTMRAGETIFFELPKLAAIRNLAQSHNVHHRGQLQVYLRLLDIPLPPVYGNTADTQI